MDVSAPRSTFRDQKELSYRLECKKGTFRGVSVQEKWACLDYTGYHNISYLAFCDDK